MKITVNGEETTLDKSLTVSELLVEQQVKMPEMVTVELNGSILNREAYADTSLQESDQVEFLYYMGGGR